MIPLRNHVFKKDMGTLCSIELSSPTLLHLTFLTVLTCGYHFSYFTEGKTMTPRDFWISQENRNYN